MTATGWSRRSAVLVALVSFLLLHFVPADDATAVEPSEYELKAALLYNFARFADWPEETDEQEDGAFVIAVVGEDPFGAGLDDAVRARSVGGRPIALRRWRGAEEVGDCQVLYISVSDREETRRIVNSLRGRPVLTVSDTRGFADSGGAIGLGLVDGRVRMTINMATVRASGIRISSKLLALSTLIEEIP